jgi:hypothetical protein
MSGFSAEWLALREPYDVAARNAVVLDAVARAFGGHTAVAVLDLACGTGSTLRAISTRLPARQSWRLVDNDLGLLARAAALGRVPHLTVTPRPVDLARDLELALEGPLDLVATSALLDLVSQEWLDRLVVETAARRLPVYAALTYDGRAQIEPCEPLDDEVIAGVNRHQRTDKGFGPALGPAAAARVHERFQHYGFALVEGRSDWVMGRDDRDIQEQIFTGWAQAAVGIGELSAERTAGWLAARRRHVAEGRSTLRVGHVDLFAAPSTIR